MCRCASQKRDKRIRSKLIVGRGVWGLMLNVNCKSVEKQNMHVCVINQNSSH